MTFIDFFIYLLLAFFLLLLELASLCLVLLGSYQSRKESNDNEK